MSAQSLLRVLLADLPVTATSIAERAGISYSALLSYRAGRRQPTPATLQSLAKALEAEAERLRSIAAGLTQLSRREREP